MSTTAERGLPSEIVNEESGALTDFNPRDHLIGVIDHKIDVQQLLCELVDAGVARDDVRLFIGEEGAERIDPTGNKHGVVMMLKRFIQATHTDFDFEHYYANEAKEGNYVVTVHCPDDELRVKAQELLQAHGARNLFYFGRISFEEIYPR